MMVLEIQWSAEAARPSDDSLKFSQLAGIVQARCDLLAREIRKLSDNVLGGFASRQVPQHNADGNPCPLQPRLAAKDFRVAYDVVFPCHRHGLILARFHGKGKSRR